MLEWLHELNTISKVIPLVLLLKWSSYRLIMSSTVFPDFIPLWLGASFFFNPAHPNRFEPNEVEQTLFSLFLWRDSWNNHLVKCQHQSSISSLLWAGPEQMSSFYGLNKCVQYASLIEIPAAVVQISIDRLQPLLKTSSNDMASLCKLTEPERNGLAHLVSPNFK